MGSPDVPQFPFAGHAGCGPAPDYERLATGGPFVDVRLPGGLPGRLVTRYEEVRSVLADPRFSRAAAAGLAMTARSPESLALNKADPPDHTRRRRTVTAAFTAQRAEALRPMLEDLADGLLEAMAGRGAPADLIEAYTLPLSRNVIAAILGVPVGDAEALRPSVNAMMSMSGYSRAEIADAHERVFGYFADLVRAKKGGAGDDLLSELVAGAGRPLTDDEVVHVVYGLFIAGYETTANHLAMCVYALLREHGGLRVLAGVAGESGGWARAVDELLRCTSLVAPGLPPHVARKDVPLGGAVIRAGEVVVPVCDTANRDPGVFEEPDRLDLRRAHNPHLAFGHGRHHCLGAPLARLELQVGLAKLCERLPGLELAVDAGALRWRSGMFVRGLWALPVRWEGAR